MAWIGYSQTEKIDREARTSVLFEGVRIMRQLFKGNGLVFRAEMFLPRHILDYIRRARFRLLVGVTE